MNGSEQEMAERRKLSWRAIAAGALAALGIQVFMFYLGAALGLPSYHRAMGLESPAIIPAVYLLISALLASYFGAWIAGHWANLYSAEDAYLHGGLTWALWMLVMALGLGAFMDPRFAFTPTQATPLAASQESRRYEMLDDPRFVSFISSQARAYAEKLEPSALQVSTRSEHLAVAREAGSDQLRRFVMAQSGMNSGEAREFLKADQAEIADELARSRMNWERAHARELAEAATAQRAAKLSGWSMTILAVLALGISLLGAHVGWRQRYVRYAPAASNDDNAFD